ncbi:hypothetical protein BH23VER1_BH23VER1_19170 [soil metagenome]
MTGWEPGDSSWIVTDGILKNTGDGAKFGRLTFQAQFAAEPFVFEITLRIVSHSGSYPRPRIQLMGSEFYLGNEGYSRRLSIHGKGLKDVVRVSDDRYSVGTWYTLRAEVTPEKNVTLYTNGELTHTGTLTSLDPQPIQLRAGDGWSGGKMEISAIDYASKQPNDALDRLRAVFVQHSLKCVTAQQITDLCAPYLGQLENLLAAEDGLPKQPVSEEISRIRRGLEEPLTLVPEPEPIGLQLDNLWKGYSGGKKALEDFARVLGSGKSTPDTSRDDSIRFPLGGHYLQNGRSFLAEIKGVNIAQLKTVTPKSVAHPGWPRGSFYAGSYVGDFSYQGMKFNAIQIVTDSANQVVAFQLQDDLGRQGSAVKGKRLSGYYNFVSSRRVGSSLGSVEYSAISKDAMRIIHTTYRQGRIPKESCILFIAGPVAHCCRSIITEAR